MKKILGEIYLTYLKIKVRMSLFIEKANVIVIGAMLLGAIAILFTITAPMIKFTFSVPRLKRERLEAIEQKKQADLREEMIIKNTVGDGDILIDFNECYKYEISGISPLINVKVEMNDFVGDHFIYEYPIDVKMSLKTESGVESISSYSDLKNGDVITFEIDVEAEELADCEYTFENIYKEVKIENFPTYFDANNPLSDELIDKWHNYLKRNLTYGDSEVTYLGFYEAAEYSSLGKREPLMGDYNRIQALYLTKDANNSITYHY